MHFLVTQGFAYIGIVAAEDMETTLKICFPRWPLSEERRCLLREYPKAPLDKPVRHSDGLIYNVRPIEPHSVYDDQDIANDQRNAYYLVFHHRKSARSGRVIGFRIGSRGWEMATILLDEHNRRISRRSCAISDQEGSYVLWEVRKLTGPME